MRRCYASGTGGYRKYGGLNQQGSRGRRVRRPPSSLLTSHAGHRGFKGAFLKLPSVHLAYAAALARKAGHEVAFSSSELLDGDVAIVLSSLVDHRRESEWARAMRARGIRVGFVG